MITLHPHLTERKPGHQGTPEAVQPIAALIEHHRTQIYAPDGSQRRGATRWTGRDVNGRAWLQWNWLEVQPHLITVEIDPFSVRSNIEFLDAQGEPLARSRRAIALLTLVYELPWRRPVMNLLYPGQDISSDWVTDH